MDYPNAVHSQARIVQRAQDVLDFLLVRGPSTIAKISHTLGVAQHLVRYAMVTLRLGGFAHTEKFVLEYTEGSIPHYIAVFKAGVGVEAVLPFRDPEIDSDKKLDWKSTAHLQPVYVEWTRTRTPDFVEEE